MDDPDGKYSKLKQSYKDIVDTFNLSVMDNKSQSQILALGSQFKRDILIEAVMKLKGLCEEAFGLYDNFVNNIEQSDVSKVAEKVHTNVVSDIVEKVKCVMNEMVPSLVTNALKARNNDDISVNETISNEEKHIIVIEDKQNKDNKYDSDSWSKVVKSSLNGKLKNIPVQKSLVNKSGQGCIFFPTKDDQEQAQSVLQSDYTVSLSTKKKRMLLPKLKVFRIDPSYKRDDKEVLKLALIEKNSNIAAYVKDGHTFEVIVIDELRHYAVLKMSPEIRSSIIVKGSVYLDMQSLEVKDHFHTVQCFSCQEYGHKTGDDLCKHKGSDNCTCLYCGDNHQSKSCPVKKDSSKLKCSNCLNSKNAEHRENAHGHTTTSSSCPFSIQQMKSLINRTQGLNLKNFFH